MSVEYVMPSMYLLYKIRHDDDSWSLCLVNSLKHGRIRYSPHIPRPLKHGGPRNVSHINKFCPVLNGSVCEPQCVELCLHIFQGRIRHHLPVILLYINHIGCLCDSTMCCS